MGAEVEADAPLTLGAEEVARLQSLNDPISLDEVIATGQYMVRSVQAGRPFLRTFLAGGPDPAALAALAGYLRRESAGSAPGP